MSEYYDILGVAKDCTQEDIKREYRKKALENHPDRNNGDKSSTEKFQKITEAYNVLGNIDTRRKYDAGILDDGGGSQPDISDILNNMFGGGGHPFGGMFGGMFGGGGGGGKKQVDIIHCEVTLEEIYNGTTKKIDYDIVNICQTCNGCGADDPKNVIKCMNCNGTGTQTQRLGPMFITQSTCSACFGNGTIIKNNKKCKNCNGQKEANYKKSFKMEVPKGIPDNFQHKLDGKGNFNKQIGQFNDLLIAFHYVNVPNIVVDSDSNINMTLEIKLEELLCGFKKTVSPYGIDLVIVSTGYFNPTHPKIFKDKGLPIIRKQGFGNLVVQFKVLYNEDKLTITKYQDVFYKIFKRDAITLDQNDLIIL